MIFFSKSQTHKTPLNRRGRRTAALHSVKCNAPAAPLAKPNSPVTEKPIIFWIGNDYANLFNDGALYGFTCRWFSGLDLSHIYQAKCLVASNVGTLDKFSSCINFACEHGIPSIWLHKTLPPETAYWAFSSHFHLDDSALFWGHLCHLVG